MALAALVAGGASLLGNAFSFFQGSKQRDLARIMQGADPGYQGNPALQENADILQRRFGNYRLPGYSQAMDNIGQGAQAGYRSVMQGATSSSDILDGATRIAYGSQSAANQLAAQQAQGQDQALMQYLSANQMAGQEIANANAWQREQYLRNVTNQANLANAGLANQGNAIQGALNTVGQLGAYMLTRPETTVASNNAAGSPPAQQSLFNGYSPGSAWNAPATNVNPFLPQTVNV